MGRRIPSEAYETGRHADRGGQGEALYEITDIVYGRGPEAKQPLMSLRSI